MGRKKASGNVFTRRQLLKYGLYGGLTAGVSGSLWLSGCSQKTDERPTNIILISIDTLRADHLSCYGYKRPTSPTLDKLASQGLLFEEAISTSPWTLPAHGSLLTGMYPNRHGLKLVHRRLPSNITTLADVLKGHGLRTAAIVNSHYVSQRYGFNRGFDDFLYIKEFPETRVPTQVEPKAYEWLSQNSSKPFFLFLHYYDPHSNYWSLPIYEKLFVNPDYKGIADGSTNQLINFRHGNVSLDRSDAKHLINLYDAGILQLDDGISRLLSFLEKHRLLDNTVLIITADHGEEFLDHGGVLHGQTQYEEMIHVPLIMHGPGIPKSKRIKKVASLVDIMPTILSLQGIAPPASLDGIDLSVLWRESKSALPQRYVFAEASKGAAVPKENNPGFDIKRAVRHPRYKLHYDRQTKQVQLYDLRLDPAEKVDVASEHPALVDSMFSQLKEFMNIKSQSGTTLKPLSPEEIQRLKSLGYMK